MKTALLALGLGVFTLAACDDGTTNTTPPAGTAADNTGKNVRDRDPATKTPPDQSESESDVKATAEIRRAITSDDTMSMNARNCKIIVSGGVATLRGPVDSQAEKDAIEAKARATAGVTSVVNELEVKVP